MSTIEQWYDALEGVIVRHPDRRNTVKLELLSGPSLSISMDKVTSTVSEELWSPFQISTVKLSYFPGVDLARKWLAAAWAGYCAHEALELVTVGDWKTRPLDPHEEPYPTNPYNKGLRDGFPVELTPETLRLSLLLVMSPEQVSVLMKDTAISGLTPEER